jgi:poly-gamma-glutamate capsule biosynthesis protein CapA/YwtB (metallophosphatase superfamily)
MAQHTPSKQDPWIPAFAVALATFAGSLMLLALAIARAGGSADVAAQESTPAASSTAAASATLPAGARLTFAGTLPPALADLNVSPVEPGKKADISFETGDGAEAVTTRIFVPVAALGTGVDALTAAQLASLTTSTVTDWAGVGGVAGKVHLAVAGPDTDRALEASFAPGLATATVYDSYDSLRAAMAYDSGILAFVPLSEVRVSMLAVAIDGVDVVRGRGDASAWPFVEKTPLQALTGNGRDALAAVRTQMTATTPKATHVIATGDILQSRCTLAAIRATGDWGAALRGPMGDYLAAADLTLGSLDGSIQDIGTPYYCVQQEWPNLTSPPEVMEALTLAGFDEMTVATNHVFDCGEITCGNKAFLQTLERLPAAGIKVVGGGKNLEEALAPAIFDAGGVTFGVLGFDDIAAEDLEATDTEAGTAPLDDSYADEKADAPAEPAFYKPADMLHLTRFEERIRALKQQVDVVIVQVQSGFEDTHEASPRSIKALRAAADAGADLVVGNQGHNVQSAEVRGNSFLAYALGNFIFDQRHTVAETQGYVLEATFWGKQLVNVRMLPYEIVDQYKPTFVDGNTRAQILTDVWTASAALP